MGGLGLAGASDEHYFPGEQHSSQETTYITFLASSPYDFLLLLSNRRLLCVQYPTTVGASATHRDRDVQDEPNPRRDISKENNRATGNCLTYWQGLGQKSAHFVEVFLQVFRAPSRRSSGVPVLVAVVVFPVARNQVGILVLVVVTAAAAPPAAISARHHRAAEANVDGARSMLAETIDLDRCLSSCMPMRYE